jgi:hypothetical protein
MDTGWHDCAFSPPAPAPDLDKAVVYVRTSNVRQLPLASLAHRLTDQKGFDQGRPALRLGRRTTVSPETLTLLVVS